MLASEVTDQEGTMAVSWTSGRPGIGHDDWTIRTIRGGFLLEAVKRPTPNSLHVLVAHTYDELIAKIDQAEGGRQATLT